MTASLSSIVITNFRSIRGTITVPLDAPVILLHGPNGAGKTSVLSAIELALTGEIAAMRRTDPTYRSHLVHRDADLSRIVLSAMSEGERPKVPPHMLIRGGEIEGRPWLGRDSARFFSERCYLAQSTLGRLLEIYQNAPRGEESPLTRFVNDLLGLDQLDALIDGLHATGDVRNLRKLAPEYADAERARDVTSAHLAEALSSRMAAAKDLLRLWAEIREALTFIGADAIYQSNSLPPDVGSTLSNDAEEKELISLNAQRRDLASLRQRNPKLAASAADVLRTAEAEDKMSTALVQSWSQSTGQGLEALIQHLREVFPDLPSVAATNPKIAYGTAVSRVDTEIARCNGAIENDDKLLVRIEEVGREAEQSRARIALADEQIAVIAGGAEDLSRALATLLPHIRGDDCPVCGRDYGEVSGESLSQHVSANISRLSEQAGRLQDLGRTRVDASAELNRLNGERESLIGGKLAQDMRTQLKARAAALIASKRELDTFAAGVDEGAAILKRQAEASRTLADLRAADRLAIEIRGALVDVCAAVGQVPPMEAESTQACLDRLDAHVGSRHQFLLDRQNRRRQAVDWLRQYRLLEIEVARYDEVISRETSAKDAQERALQAAEVARNTARAVARAAADARIATVGRVFNTSLNKVWRDLFVRLAPSEPFVPAFRLPQSTSDPVSAQLETLYRQGGTGGAPGAMLSAGNLNTAALTLFVALHLSAKADLPWLILDDPVQSMDEVHIAQFAALLRTMSKEHGRQIVIAVHERPLFDYLTLELSPAFPGDRLITVELKRPADSDTTADPTFRGFEPDRAVAA